MIFQILILAVVLFVLPAMAGAGFGSVMGEDDGNPLFCWVSGQICFWAGFLAICVPLILKETEKGFIDVTVLFGIYMAAMLLLSAGTVIRRKTVGPVWRQSDNLPDPGKDFVRNSLWLIFLIILLAQLVLAVVMTYDEGDDAFYVAVASVTSKSNTMYQVLPYTGGSTGLDARHGLAPFPIWVAFLSRISGMEAVTVAKVALPVVLIMMAYAIFMLLGRKLFGKDSRKLPLLMIFLEILILYGGQSVYTAENFLLVRTAQGKAVLANIVIPFLFLLMYILLERLEEQRSVPVNFWILLSLTMLAGCLCSTLGALLTCMVPGVIGFCGGLCFKNWKILVSTVLCCIFPVGMAILYILLG